LVKEADFQANRKTHTINVTDIPNGIYMLKIESGNKNLGILRVVVE